MATRKEPQASPGADEKAEDTLQVSLMSNTTIMRDTLPKGQGPTTHVLLFLGDVHQHE